MRPVKKGTAAQNTYAYDDTSTVSFPQDPYRSLSLHYFKTKTPTVDECSDFLLDFVKGLRDENQSNTKMATGIESRFEDMYKTAALKLLARMNNYCSYCENIITTYLEVEHTVPKDPYPTYTVIWKNFLVGCGPCNQLKSNDPSRGKVEKWLNNYDPTEAEYYDCIRVTNYVWPDLDNKSYRLMPSELWYFSDSANDWKTLPAPGNMDLNNVVTKLDPANREITASINHSGTVLTRKVQMRIRNQSELKLSHTTIYNCQLNLNGNPNNTNDRRVYMRTEAYFAAVRLLKRLSDAIVSQSVFDLFWPGYTEMAKSLGFYSVFLRVLKGRTDPSGNDLQARFIADTNIAGFFPNTNLANLP